MDNQDLIKKLNILKQMEPDQAFLRKNRELLLSQISNAGAENIPSWRVFVISFSSVFKTVSRPAFAFGAFILMLFTGALFSNQLLEGAKPSDSLYVARIVSEKLKLNTTFNQEERDKLAIRFASDHAKDISTTLADSALTDEEKVAELNNSFHKEVDNARNHLASVVAKSNPQPAVDKPSEATAESNGDIVVLAEDSLKGNSLEFVSKTETAAPLVAEKTATTTEGEATSTPEIVEPNTEPSQILDEAKQLFEQKDYLKAADKLKQIDEMIK